MSDVRPLSASQLPRYNRGRLLVRLLAEMQTSATAYGLRVFDGDLDRAILFMVIARHSGTLFQLSDGHAGAGERGTAKGISINALAASLSRPFETVRRHVKGLTGAGLCLRTAAGVIVPADVHDRPDIAALFRMHHDVLVRLMEDMVWFDMPLPETRPQVAYDWRTGLVAAHDILLTGLEFHAPRYSCWLDLLIVTTIMCANARPFTYDRKVSLHYSDFNRLPSESMRAPVPASVVARALGLPASTTQRRVNLLLEAGALIRKSNGLLVSEPTLNDGRAVEDSRASTDHTRQIFARLATGGFRFDQPALCYADSRPELTVFA
ncbi:ArsR family transcriptional regulator [Sphingomonas sp. AOB5]|uniref:ArsR family transcriptional regulator n=1 Tax=Sphingomonas sp. AOB5 TaxID=3034017 RepID=UPI0023F6278B|nr:ArsR family transcriptional regulator [Sphingomonas sp. AOB5]MDF7775205.1 ArsR family transcriptional regulator [Sphingomonas sp. AOB5]